LREEYSVLLRNLLLGAALFGQVGPSLQETLAWLENFCKTHGYSGEYPYKSHINTLSVVQSCSIFVEHQYVESGPIRKRSEKISLGDFDPTNIKTSWDVTNAAKNPVFLIQIERSDAASLIVADAETNDGTKKQIHISEEFFMMNDEDSGKRFVVALTHAIKLCGGKPAPF
jgi:hypothetical protein